MNGKNQRPFVYGTFRYPRKGVGGQLPAIGAPLPGEPDIALEVLREFGTTEFIGKIYVRTFGGSQWAPGQWDLIQSTPWYRDYLQFKPHFLFDMAGSGTWEIIHFRTETDETGPYVAVAVRFQPKTPPWVENQRERERSRR